MPVESKAVSASPNVHINIWRSRCCFCKVYNAQSDILFSRAESTDVSIFTQVSLMVALGIENDMFSILPHSNLQLHHYHLAKSSKYIYGICLFEITILQLVL